MGTVKDKLELLLTTKLSIRDAIISKGQAVAGTDPFSSYAEKIAAIQTGVDTSDATAGAGDILSGKTAYADGKKITGSIPGRGAADLTASGAAVTAPAGYYPSQVTKKVAEAAQATPSITIGSNGLITASVSQGEGYVAAGTRSATRQLTTQTGKTVTPGTSLQTAVASGRYTTGTVYVAGDANLAAGNIKSGVSIFGVAGSARTVEYISVKINNATTYIYTIYANGNTLTLGAQSGTTIVIPRNGIIGIYFRYTGGSFSGVYELKSMRDFYESNWKLNLYTILAEATAPEISVY